MFNPSDLLLTSSDLTKIACEVVLTLAFLGILFAYFSAAAAFA
jgi:hypothetical protein